MRSLLFYQLQWTETSISRWKFLQLRLQELLLKKPSSSPLPPLDKKSAKNRLIALRVSAIVLAVFAINGIFFPFGVKVLACYTLAFILEEVVNLLAPDQSLIQHVAQFSEVTQLTPLEGLANYFENGHPIDPISFEPLIPPTQTVVIGKYIFSAETALRAIFIREPFKDGGLIPHPIERRSLREEEMSLIADLALFLAIEKNRLIDCLVMVESEYVSYLNRIISNYYPDSPIDQHAQIRGYFRDKLKTAFRLHKLGSLNLPFNLSTKFSWIAESQVFESPPISNIVSPSSVDSLSIQIAILREQISLFSERLGL